MTDSSGEKNGERLRTLAERLSIQEKDWSAIKAKAGANLKRIVVEAASGRVPSETEDADKKRFKSHGRTWFKTADGGRELTSMMFELGIWPAIRDQLLPFCNSVRCAVGLPEIEDILL